MVDMSVKIGSVTLKNPIMPASGAFSTELARAMDINRLGALVTKTVSREYRIGNPPPRVAELEGGMINSIGLPGKGLRYFLEHQLPEYKRYTPPIVANITATTTDDFAAMAREVTLPEVDVIEMNISCPTREPGGGNFALHEDHTYEIVRRVRAATDKPLWAKLSRLKINTETFKPMIGNGYGGISGPGIKPIIMRMVHQCSKVVKIPIIGCGGIVKVEDVVEYMLAGASAVMIGYFTFRNPSGMIAIIEGLEKWCERRGFTRVADLTGGMIFDKPAATLEAAAAPIG